MKSLVLSLLFAFSFADHIAYLSYYDNAGCSGDPEFYAPLWHEATNCLSLYEGGASTCSELLQLALEPGLDCPVSTFETTDGGLIQSDFGGIFLPFDTCISVADDLCFLQIYRPEHVYIPSADVDTQPGPAANFAAYFNLLNSCSGSIEGRIPVFEGNKKFCYRTSGTDCRSQLRGFTDPSAGITCDDSTWSADGCDLTIDSVPETYNVCTSAEQFSLCSVYYSGSEIDCSYSYYSIDDDDDFDFSITTNIGNGDDDETGDDNETGDDDDVIFNNDDDSDDDNSDDDSSSPSSLVMPSIVASLITLLMVC